MKTVYRRVADLIFIAHIAVVIIVLVGWAFPQQLLWMYQVTVILTFLFGLLHRGTCILTKYEWQFRRKYHIGEFNDNLFIPYYLKRYLGINVSEKMWNACTITLVVVSFIYVLYTLFK